MPSQVHLINEEPDRRRVSWWREREAQTVSGSSLWQVGTAGMNEELTAQMDRLVWMWLVLVWISWRSAAGLQWLVRPAWAHTKLHLTTKLLLLMVYIHLAHTEAHHMVWFIITWGRPAWLRHPLHFFPLQYLFLILQDHSSSFQPGLYFLRCDLIAFWVQF